MSGGEQAPLPPPSSSNAKSSKIGLIVGQSFSTVMYRSLQMYIFWFLVFVVAAFLYNEVVISETMRRYTGYRTKPYVDDDTIEQEEFEQSLDNGESLTLGNHQIMSMAATGAFVMLAVRIVFETMYVNNGSDVYALLSGNQTYNHRHDDDDDESSDEDENVPQQQFSALPPPPTSLYAAPATTVQPQVLALPQAPMTAPPMLQSVQQQQVPAMAAVTMAPPPPQQQQYYSQNVKRRRRHHKR